MDLSGIHRIYFIGIGGIGMSSLARYFLQLGKEVAGYDRTATPLTRELEKEGMTIHYRDDVNMIPPVYRDTAGTGTLVVMTPAIPPDHGEWKYFREKGFTVVKRSQVLGWLSNEHITLAVAGTHGKTTVSTMLAHIMDIGPGGCLAFLGGISKNHRSNLIGGPGARLMVAEADEYDRSFLHLSPSMAIITAMDDDHLDIYGNGSHMREAFVQFAGRIRPGGSLIVKKGLREYFGPMEGISVYEYHLEQTADYYTDNLRVESGAYHFDLVHPSGVLRNTRLGLPGKINVENAIAAAGLALLNGAAPDTVQGALNGFSGVIRRFDIRINTPRIVYMDDYAHHPEELRACIGSVRELFPGRKITGIFQPHLYSRTRDLAAGFAASLDLLDRLILLDIYPAREKPVPGVSSENIFSLTRLEDKQMCAKEDAVSLIADSEVDILLSLGAGDIDTLVGPLEKLLLARINNHKE